MPLKGCSDTYVPDPVSVKLEFRVSTTWLTLTSVHITAISTSLKGIETAKPAVEPRVTFGRTTKVSPDPAKVNAVPTAMVLVVMIVVVMVKSLYQIMKTCGKLLQIQQKATNSGNSGPAPTGPAD